MSEKEPGPYNSNVTCTGFSVEARCQGDFPHLIGGKIYDNRWKPVEFERVPPPLGTRQSGYMGEILDLVHLFGYHTAEALRHQFHITAEVEAAGFSVETRLVAWKIQCRAEWTRQEERSYVGTWAARQEGDPK